MNKILRISVSICLLLCVTAFSACSAKPVRDTPSRGTSSPETSPQKIISIDGIGYTEVNDDIMGVSLALPKQALDDWTILYGPFSQDAPRTETSPVDGSYLQFMPMVVDNCVLFNIEYYEESKWDSWMADGKDVAIITGCPTNEEIGRQAGMVYIYSVPDADKEGMDEATAKTYQDMLDLLPTIRKSIKLIPRASSLKGSIPDFNASDLEGNAVDSVLFSKHKLTVLNFWATFCGPCIDEMPDLQEMSQSMPKGTLLAGVVGDATSPQYIKLAKEIADKTGVKYVNIAPDKALSDYIKENIAGYPTTIFVDSKGNIVGDVLIGGHSRKEYEAELASRLNSLEGNPPAGQPAATSIQAPDENTQRNQPANGQATDHTPTPDEINQAANARRAAAAAAQ